MKLKYRQLMWIAIVMLAFVLGLYAGFVLHEEFMIKGLVRIAEGLEGTNIEVNIDLNETKIVEGFAKVFNETLSNNQSFN